MANGIKVDGVARYDNFAKEITIMANSIFESTGLEKTKRKDESEIKRAELHMHTQMSQMDGVTPAEDLIKRAIDWGWKSIAITDHGVVQAFPDAYHLIQKVGDKIKVIYGVEGYYCPDKDNCVFNSKGQNIDTEYSVLDLETTGFSPINEKITEIAKTPELNPYSLPIKAVKQHTTAECELGIPPAPMILLKLNCFVVTKSHITLNV